MWDFPHVYNKRPNECIVIEGLFMECQNSKIKRILYILLFLCVQEKKNPEETCILDEVWTQHEQKSSLIWNSKRQKLLHCNSYFTSQSGFH